MTEEYFVTTHDRELDVQARTLVQKTILAWP